MITLSSVSPGLVMCVHVAGDGPEVVRLKRMGVCAGREVEVVHAGDPMILRVAGTRVGVSKKLASVVYVEWVGSEPRTIADDDGRADQ